MKKLILAIGLLTIMGCKKETPVDLKKDLDLRSYSIGQQIGRNIKTQGIELNQSALAQGIVDAINGKEQVSKEEIQKALMGIQQDVMKRTNAEIQENMEKGKVFLAENKKHPRVRELQSGVQILIEKDGVGDTIKKTSKIKMNYVGTLIDGKEFDSSYKRKIPLQVTVEQAFPGWRDALLYMKKGGIYKVVVPAEKGYGRSSRPNIPAGSTLIYKIEILDVN